LLIAPFALLHLRRLSAEQASMTFAEVCQDIYLHGPKRGEPRWEALLPVIILVWTMLKAAEPGPMGRVMQQYIPGIVKQDTGELHLLEGHPGKYWRRRYTTRKASMLREVQDRIHTTLHQLTDSCFDMLQQNVVYHQLLGDSVDPEDAPLMPFLYNQKDVSWCQRRLGWSLPKLGYKMMKVISTGCSTEEQQKGLYYLYTTTFESSWFRISAYKNHTQDRSCASCGASPAVGQSHRKCGGCGVPRYCSLKCQKHNWKQEHKRVCCEEFRMSFVTFERQKLIQMIGDV